MTPAQARLVELDQKKEDYKKFMEELSTVTQRVAAEVGVNGYFQDERGTVYKLVEPNGKFVYFDKLSYVRTKRPGEKAGTLSAKEAREAGFTLEG